MLVRLSPPLLNKATSKSAALSRGLLALGLAWLVLLPVSDTWVR